MPIVRVQNKLLYFAHVPKCGGTAVERYLWLRFGRIAFDDQRFYRNPPDLRWSRTSPQHISGEALARYFPADFFDGCFAVVRNPVDRLVSEYHHLRDAMGRIPKSVSLSEWLQTIPATLAADRWAYDNHLRSICEMLPSGAVWFRLEDGLEKVVAYLDGFAGNQDGPRVITPKQERNPNIPKAIPTQQDIALIERIYARDFETFRYPTRSLATVRPHASGSV